MTQKSKVLKFATPELAAGASIPEKEEYQRLVYSEVYAPNRPDSDNCFMEADVIERMAHEFIASGKVNQVDLFHNNKIVEGCCVVESFIAREGDPTFIVGSWVVGIYVGNDDVWRAILDGTINGFSVEALVYDEQVEVDILNTGEIKGYTTTQDDHSHTFTVTYDDQGNLLGGKTDTVNGHFHKIVSGTVTSYATSKGGKTHKHNFSYVENLIVKQ